MTIQNVICDIDGVLMHDNVAVPGAAEFIKRILEKEMPLVMLTNYPSQTGQDLANRFATAGIDVPDTAFYTSAMATADFLRRQEGKKAYVVGEGALIHELYGYQPVGAGHTTYNAGVISGGTSVNTIAQECSMLYEARSDEAEALVECENYLYETLKKRKTDDVQIECKKIGERPCMGVVDTEKIMRIAQKCSDLIEKVTGKRPAFGQASTDCNIPLAMEIPSLCIGLIEGAGAHTLEEWINPESLTKGFQIAVGVFETVTEEH